MVHRSRWGWHPCDYATFLLLKELNILCERALHQFAAWRRWQRKLPHNRVLRRKIVDANGRKVGTEIVGPQPEPPLPAFFSLRRHVRTYWSADGKPLKDGRMVEEVLFDHRGLPEAYRAARRPAATEGDVKPLLLSAEEIRFLKEQAAELAKLRA